MVAPQNFDGIYFLPGDEDDTLVISYFDFKGEYANGRPIESSSMGDKFHFAFFKSDENDQPIFDESFEAILGDPSKYVNNLVGAGVYGCVVRKTNKSDKWFSEYLDRTKGRFDKKT